MNHVLKTQYREPPRGFAVVLKFLCVFENLFVFDSLYITTKGPLRLPPLEDVFDHVHIKGGET